MPRHRGFFWYKPHPNQSPAFLFLLLSQISAMKRLIPLLLFSLGLSAQSFVSFPDSNARWINSYSTLNTSGQFYYYDLAHTLKFCLSAEDTLINSKSFSKLYYCGTSSAYFGALRDSAGQVFVVPADSSEALLIYDFNLLPGDTIKEVYALNSYQPWQWGGFSLLEDLWGGPLTVQQVDTVISPLGQHRVIYPSTSGGGWIEGIGNSQGLFWDPFGNISNFQISLECMSRDDSIYFQGPDWQPLATAITGPCDLDLSSPEQISKTPFLYPNPSSGFLKFSNSEPGALKIFSLNGILIESHILGPQATLNLQHLAKGLYILEFSNARFRWLKT